jgi:hypothetical protein
MKTMTKLAYPAFALVCFTHFAHGAGLNPPPDGGYPGGNTAEGANALFSLTTGGYNTGVGWFSLRNNMSGSYNTALGAATLFANTGNQNTATGAAALFSNTTGFRNTANGAFALLHNNAADNTATGNAALLTNTTGSGNTAAGNFALVNNDTGSNNTAVGNGALGINTGANDNTAVGAGALGSGTTSGNNTAIGSGALATNTFLGGFNTAVGASALSNNSGIGNIAIGATAGGNITTASNVICIGSQGQDVSNSCYVGQIFGITPGGVTVPVSINADGQLGAPGSSRRFKKDIQPMDKTSEAILALKPITFHYKSDSKGIAQFGLVAEEVAEVNPDLVVRNKDGEIYSVRYDAVNAMLLNEFLKERRKVQELQVTVAHQRKSFQSKLAEQQAQIDALASGLQKVSAEFATASPSRGGLEMSKPASNVVVSNP